MEINPNVVGLLANAHSHSAYSGKRFYFKGDLCQMSTAQSIASKLGISTDVEGGLPFVMSQEDFDTVTQYLIDNGIEGWWHYVSRDEYRRIKGEFTFTGEYSGRETEIQKIADELGIFVGKVGAFSIPYVRTEENYHTIIERLK